jgi:opacity protein-like surface antigen
LTFALVLNPTVERYMASRLPPGDFNELERCMKSRLFTIGLFLSLIAAAGSPAATAQHTDIGLSLYGAFTGTTTSSGVTTSPSNAAGGLIEVRRLANPILGFEGTYAFNRANEKYSSTVAITCPISTVNPCPPLSQSITANAHEITADWVPHVQIANLRPFGILGVGVLLNVPDSGQSNTQTSTKGVYVYGAGLDWGLVPHLGLRLQYRGNLYSKPDLSKLYTSASGFTHTAEPMIGAYLRF